MFAQEPKLKSEIHWSDPEEQQARGNWFVAHRRPLCIARTRPEPVPRYGAAKTVQEKMCIEFVAKMPAPKRFRFVSICPTAVRSALSSVDMRPLIAVFARR